MSTQNVSRHRLGFTLVELLVVIGIIAVLISILLPSLNKAREAANSVVCLSNLRQVGMSVQIYAGQYKDTLPDSLSQWPAPRPTYSVYNLEYCHSPVWWYLLTQELGMKKM